MKGVVEIALGVALIVILLEGFFLNVLIGREVTLKQSARELEIIKSVNRMESVKRGLPYALYYSFQQALKMGGYSSFSDVGKLEEFEKNVSLIFSKYRDEIEEESGIVVPSGEITITQSDDEISISFISSELMSYEHSSTDFSFRIYDNPNATVKIRNGELVE